MKQKLLAILLVIFGLCLFSACNNSVNLSEVTLINNSFTYTGEEITPVFSNISSGCEINIFNANNEPSKIIDAGTYFIRVSKNGSTKLFRLTVNKKVLDLSIEDKIETYNGNKHNIDAHLNYELNEEYEIIITYNNFLEAPTESGEYNVEAVLNSKNYYAYSSCTLTIEKSQLNINSTLNNYFYTGSEVAPIIEYDCEEECLVSYKTLNNITAIDVGTYSYIIEVESTNYYGCVTKDFNVIPKKVDIQLTQHTFDYCENEIDVLSYIKSNDDIELELICDKPIKDSGIYNVIIKPNNNNYCGELNTAIIVSKKLIELKLEEQCYTFSNNFIHYELDNKYEYNVLYNNSKDLPFNAGEYIVYVEII